MDSKYHLVKEEIFTNLLKSALIDQEKCRGIIAGQITNLIKIAQRCIQTWHNGGKIIACGNGGSSGDAQHLASELLNKYKHDRVALAAMAITSDAQVITSIANDRNYLEIFSRQLQGLLQAQDTLIVFTTSGNSSNIIEAVNTAKNKGVNTIAFTGFDGGKIAKTLSETDIELRIAINNTARVQEMHLTCIHLLCEYMDYCYSK
ncbi:MAG: SIS domain-containing protein [Methylacidiphilales bacterium]|nr:SIS domain-containing protein [Candidatus Methylacidiphilales bacterium]